VVATAVWGAAAVVVEVDAGAADYTTGYIQLDFFKVEGFWDVRCVWFELKPWLGDINAG
jgi:hypothetical protein